MKKETTMIKTTTISPLTFSAPLDREFVLTLSFKKAGRVDDDTEDLVYSFVDIFTKLAQRELKDKLNPTVKTYQNQPDHSLLVWEIVIQGVHGYSNEEALSVISTWVRHNSCYGFSSSISVKEYTPTPSWWN